MLVYYYKKILSWAGVNPRIIIWRDNYFISTDDVNQCNDIIISQNSQVTKIIIHTY